MANSARTLGFPNFSPITAILQAATIIPGTLATSYAVGQIIDQHTLALNDLILIKNQVITAENGVYRVTFGAPIKLPEFAIPGQNVFILFGASNSGKDFWQTTTNVWQRSESITSFIAAATTTTAGVLASDFENGDIIDGVTLTTGMTILVKNQAVVTENGIYTVNATGAPTRVTGSQTPAQIVFVTGGTLNTNRSFVQVTQDVFQSSGLSVAGNNYEVQFNSNGVLSADTNFTWDPATFTLQAGNLATQRLQWNGLTLALSAGLFSFANGTNILIAGPNFSWNGTTFVLSLSGTNPVINMSTVGVAQIPAPAPTTELNTGVTTHLGQPTLMTCNSVESYMYETKSLNRSIMGYRPNAGSAMIVLGGPALANSGTVPTHPAPTITNAQTSRYRTRFATTAVAGNISSTKQNVAIITRGNAASVGGFLLNMRFGLDVLVANNRAFIGLYSSVAAATNVDPLTSTAFDKVGIGYNTNTGNLRVIHGAAGAVPTVIDLGAAFPLITTNVISATFYCRPNAPDIQYRVECLTSGAIAEGNITTNLPTNTAFMAWHVWVTNNITAAIAAINVHKVHIEVT